MSSGRGTTRLADAIRAVAEAVDQDPTVLLEELGRQTEQLLGCEAASIHLVESTRPDLVFRRARLSAFGVAHGAALTPIWTATPELAAELTVGRPVFMADFPSSVAADLAERPWLRGFASALYAPLVGAGEFLGVLVAAWQAPRQADPEILELAEALARCAAVAVRTARVLDDARRTRSHLEAVLDAATDSIGVYDAAGRLVLGNRALHERWAGRLGGVPHSTQELRAAAKPVDPEGQPVTVLPAERALAGEAADVVMVYPDANGSGVRVHARAAPIRAEDGSVRGAVVVSRDVTALHAAEEERRAAEQRATQAEKLRALGQLASGVAHDLSQSLALVAGYAELAGPALDRDPPDLDAVRDALSVVARAAQDGGATLQALLRFARREESEPLKATVDLALLADEVARLTAPSWREQAEAEGRPISLTVEAAGPHNVVGAAGALREALTNLVLNAVDALPAGGRIVLRVRTEGERVLVEVVDSGVGMAPEVRRRIFEPFFTTKGERGTGLGLAQVYGVVQRHGGEIEVDSEVGKGTTVRLLLPAAGPIEAGPDARPAASRRLRVLAVDDEPALAQMASRVLEAGGHDVVTAFSGEEALARLDGEAFDAVVSDLGLGPGMNGWALAAQVKARWPAAGFVLVTGWGAGLDASVAKARGVDAVLAKPYQPQQLWRALADLPRDGGTLDRV